MGTTAQTKDERRNWTALFSAAINWISDPLIGTGIVIVLIVAVIGWEVIELGNTVYVAEQINISLRPSAMDENLGVLQLQNRTSSSMTVHVQLFDGKRKATYTIDSMDPTEIHEIGFLEVGRSLGPDEKITIWTNDQSAIPMRLKTVRDGDGTLRVKGDRR